MSDGQKKPFVRGGGSDALGSSAPRIVSLVPSLTELVCALGLGARLVGRTRYCLHPDEALGEVPSVGGTKDVDIGRIDALGATHVLVNVDETPREVAEALAQRGIEVVVTDPRGPLDNLPLYRQLGRLFGREAEAAELGAALSAAHRRIVAAAAQRPRRRVLYLIWRDPWMTVSRETYISGMLAAAGLDTLPAQSAFRYPEVALDGGIVREADLVLLASEPYSFGPTDRAELVAAHPELAGRVLLVDGQLVGWYGARAARGLDYLNDLAAAVG